MFGLSVFTAYPLTRLFYIKYVCNNTGNLSQAVKTKIIGKRCFIKESFLKPIALGASEMASDSRYAPQYTAHNMCFQKYLDLQVSSSCRRPWCELGGQAGKNAYTFYLCMYGQKKLNSYFVFPHTFLHDAYITFIVLNVTYNARK